MSKRRARGFSGIPAEHRKTAGGVLRMLRPIIADANQLIRAGNCQQALIQIARASQAQGAYAAERSWVGGQRSDGASVTSIRNLISKFERACMKPRLRTVK